MNPRYDRQRALPWLGEEGQRRIGDSGAGIVGIGTLGCAVAGLLCRAGVGRLTLVDRDFVEESNLPRQILFTEGDAVARLPKAIAAAARLKEIRSDAGLEAIDADLDSELARRLFSECDLVLDCTDNFETRYLLNDAAVEACKPWIYAGAVGMAGSVMAIRPPATACLRCAFPELPPPGSAPTCETAGILGPAAVAVASFQATEALKILSGNGALCPEGLATLDLMTWAHGRVKILRDPACECCGLRRFPFLDGDRLSRTHRLCGRDGVMILAPKGTRLDLRTQALRYERKGGVFVSAYLLQTEWEGHPVTLYADGRALVQKIDDPARAKALYARFVGT